MADRDAKRVARVRKAAAVEGNKPCMNCGKEGPQGTVCTTFSTFVCETCAGLHRGFSHKVKTISQSKFTEDEVKALETGGNKAARKHWLARFREQLPSHTDTNQVKSFIDKVYNQSAYVATGADSSREAQDGTEKKKEKKKKAPALPDAPRPKLKAESTDSPRNAAPPAAATKQKQPVVDLLDLVSVEAAAAEPKAPEQADSGDGNPFDSSDEEEPAPAPAAAEVQKQSGGGGGGGGGGFDGFPTNFDEFDLALFASLSVSAAPAPGQGGGYPPFAGAPFGGQQAPPQPFGAFGQPGQAPGSFAQAGAPGYPQSGAYTPQTSPGGYPPQGPFGQYAGAPQQFGGYPQAPPQQPSPYGYQQMPMGQYPGQHQQQAYGQYAYPAQPPPQQQWGMDQGQQPGVQRMGSFVGAPPAAARNTDDMFSFANPLGK